MTVEKHPLAEELLAHLMRYRGAWVAKLSPALREALQTFDSSDIKRAATLLVHGPATCPEGRERKFHRINEGWQFCASNGKCPCFMRHFHATSEATNMEKRGVKNAAQADDVKQKMRETCLDRYGIEYSGALPERRQKAEATVLEKYGVRNVFASEEIKDRIRNKMMEQYGVAHISATAEHQTRMREAVIDKYGVANVAQHPEVKAKIVATNQERYGGNAPAACAAVVEKMRRTMDERHGGHVAQRHIETQHRILDEADFRHRFTGRKVKDIVAETGYHPSMIHRYALRWSVELDFSGGDHRGTEDAFAARLTAENLVFKRNIRLLVPSGETDRRRHQEIDFYFPDHHLGVELHGAYWHSSANGRGPDYHANKLRLAESNGIDLIQIFEDEWIDRPEVVMTTIKHRLGCLSERLYARKGVIRSVAHQTAAGFYDRYHIQGPVRASQHLGLFIADALVACMSFTQRKPSQWELVRFATYNVVVGAASRLLAHFERNNEWETISSFVDLRWSQGALYTTLGFQADKRLDPDYYYVIGDRRSHKFNFRKTSKPFAKYVGMGMTEAQMAEAENLPRVYDAGKIRVIKKHPSNETPNAAVLTGV